MITNSGGDSTLEPNLSDLKTDVTLLFLDKEANASIMEPMLSSDNGEERSINGLVTTEVQEETSETLDASALMSMVEETLTICTVAG